MVHPTHLFHSLSIWPLPLTLLSSYKKNHYFLNSPLFFTCSISFFLKNFCELTNFKLLLTTKSKSCFSTAFLNFLLLNFSSLNWQILRWDMKLWKSKKAVGKDDKLWTCFFLCLVPYGVYLKIINLIFMVNSWKFPYIFSFHFSN